MPFNGSGTYTLPAGNPVTTGTTISSTTTNNTNSDIATALTNCITRDGQSTPSADLPMNSHKLTGLAAGTTAGDSVRYEQLTAKQDTLVSGTNIKTVNSTSLLGSGNVAVQETLVSGTNIKTVNSTSLLGSGDVAVQATLVSGTNIKTINSNSLLGSGNINIGSLTLGTPVNTTSGTAINFTGIPSTAKIIYIDFSHVSMDLTVDWLIQIGSSSGIENTGYESASSSQMSGTTNQTQSSTEGFVLRTPSNARYLSGLMTLVLHDTSANTWVESAITNTTDPGTILSGGKKSLAATLDRIRITTSAGTAQFDAGSINIAYM